MLLLLVAQIHQSAKAALNHGTYVGGAIVIVAAYYLSTTIFGNTAAFVAIASGLVVGLLIGKITEIYTSADYASVKKIAQQSETGPATTIISRFGCRHVFHLPADDLHLHRCNPGILQHGRC